MTIDPKKYISIALATAMTILAAPINAIAAPRTAPILDGTQAPATDYPAVAKVLLPEDGLCTGTLIASKYVLTAAHCFYTERNKLISNATDTRVVVNNVTYALKNVTIHPTYVSRSEACIDDETDAAIIELDSNVDGVTPIELLRTAPSVGAQLLLVGFGVLGTGNAGQNDNVPPDGFLYYGNTFIDKITGTTYLQWTFNRGESNTGSGDSGGPAFIDVNGTRQLSSITCGGDGNAGFGTKSFNTRVDSMAAWIDSVTGTAAPTSPPSFVGLQDISVSVGTAVNYTVQLSGATPITLTADGLPAGLSLSGTTITGTPTDLGSSTVNFTATNNVGSATASLNINVVAFNPEEALKVTKARVSFEDDGTDLLSLQGTVNLGANFNPKGQVVRIQITELEDVFKLNRQGFAQRRGGFDLVRLTGRLSRSGVYSNPTVRFYIGLGDKNSLYNKLDQLFPFETRGLASSFRVPLPVYIVINGITYSHTIMMKNVRGTDRWVSE